MAEHRAALHKVLGHWGGGAEPLQDPVLPKDRVAEAVALATGRQKSIVHQQFGGREP